MQNPCFENAEVPDGGEEFDIENTLEEKIGFL